VYKRPVGTLGLLLTFTYYLQNIALKEWAMLGSNQRPLPCEGSEPDPTGFWRVGKTRISKPNRKYRDELPFYCFQVCPGRVAARSLHRTMWRGTRS